MHRRQFLQTLGAGLLAGPLAMRTREVVVNDIHSQLNETSMAAIVRPTCSDDVLAALRVARQSGRPLIACGARHAGGGQQFASGGTLLDVSALRRIGPLDASGVLTVEAGAEWPEIVQHLRATPWTICKKQGIDRISLGGTLSANAHGESLTMGPIVDDVEWFDMACPDGSLRHCSRSENAQLFALAIGGYGLFGVFTRLGLRLQPRTWVRARVQRVRTDALQQALEQRVREGCRYGSYQMAIDSTSEGFMRDGLLTTYEAAAAPPAAVGRPANPSDDEWRQLIMLAHVAPARAFEVYCGAYLATDGRVFAVDDIMMSGYLPHYHHEVDRATHAPAPATETLAEFFVPRHQLGAYLEDVRAILLRRAVPLIYGSVRLIERDTTTFLAWAREPWACLVLNLHTVHTPAGQAAVRDALADLLSAAMARGGSYYLTYGRFATRAQLRQCYPRLDAFLAARRAHDPHDVMQSDWYRHYR